jgi:hypothetical protein
MDGDHLLLEGPERSEGEASRELSWARNPRRPVHLHHGTARTEIDSSPPLPGGEALANDYALQRIAVVDVDAFTSGAVTTNRYSCSDFQSIVLTKKSSSLCFLM